ncbi:hypothetical protein Tco_1200142 [Tanacetum coccineum]
MMAPGGSFMTSFEDFKSFLAKYTSTDDLISTCTKEVGICKGSVLLGEHNLSYRLRTAVKGQILVDFLIEKPETDAGTSCIVLTTQATGKLGPKWEGPHEVTEALGKGAYKLCDMDGRELPRTWNICNLKKCYL